MNDYEFKKALLKTLRELTAETKALRLAVTDAFPKVDINRVSRRDSCKTRHFRCTCCGFEEDTHVYEMRDGKAVRTCPECLDFMYEHN